MRLSTTVARVEPVSEGATEMVTVLSGTSSSPQMQEMPPACSSGVGSA